MYHDWSWKPIWHHVKILGQEWGNFGRPYGLLYMKGQPRFDVWWLDDRWWILGRPQRLMAATLMLLIIVGLAVSGALILRNALRRPVARRRARRVTTWTRPTKRSRTMQAKPRTVVSATTLTRNDPE